MATSPWALNYDQFMQKVQPLLNQAGAWNAQDNKNVSFDLAANPYGGSGTSWTPSGAAAGVYILPKGSLDDMGNPRTEDQVMMRGDQSVLTDKPGSDAHTMVTYHKVGDQLVPIDDDPTTGIKGINDSTYKNPYDSFRSTVLAAAAVAGGAALAGGGFGGGAAAAGGGSAGGGGLLGTLPGLATVPGAASALPSIGAMSGTAGLLGAAGTAGMTAAESAAALGMTPAEYATFDASSLGGGSVGGAGGASSLLNGGNTLGTVGSFLKDNAGLIGAGLGAIAGSQDATQTANNTKTPWAPAAPWMTSNLKTGQNLQSYMEQNPFNPQQKAAYQSLLGGIDGLNASAPGLLDFANKGMTSNYQRATGGAVGSGGGYGGPRVAGGLLQSGTGPFVAPQTQAYGQIDWQKLSPFLNGVSGTPKVA